MPLDHTPSSFSRSLPPQCAISKLQTDGVCVTISGRLHDLFCLFTEDFLQLQQPPVSCYDTTIQHQHINVVHSTRKSAQDLGRTVDHDMPHIPGT